MLIDYRKEQRKIAMGLLSFHQNLTEYQSLLKEIDTYEQDNQLRLFLWIPDGETNIQGVLGVEVSTSIIVHDIAINPSFRGEKIGFTLLDELKMKYPNEILSGTLATLPYIMKWIEYKK